MILRVPKSQKNSFYTEYEVKLAIGDCLTNFGFQVFDERQNKDRPKWGMFEVSISSTSRCGVCYTRKKQKARVIGKSKT